MPYQSIYAGKKSTLPSGKDNPYAEHFTPGQYYVKTQPQAKKADQPKPAAPPPPKTLFDKVKSGAKSFGSAMITGERVVAKPVARLLPGGQNDLKAQNDQINQNLKTMRVAKELASSSDAKKASQGKKLLASNRKDMASTSEQVNKTADEIKKDTDRKHIALGMASTAADILTGGTLPGIKAATTSAKVVDGARVVKVAKPLSLTNKITNHAIQAGGFGTAGALNAGAGGGDKKQMGEAFVAGMALPGILKVAGKGISKGAEKLTGGPDYKARLANSKTQSMLDAVRQPQTAGLDVHTEKSLNTIMSKVKPTRATVEKAQAEQASHAEATKVAEQTAKETAKNTEKASKIDNQIELTNAKKADGKFTNVDKTKVAQLEAEKQKLVPETEPTIKAYGKEIKLTKENGYQATDTADGKIYSKVARTGRNNKDSNLSTNYYDASGTKLTHEQAQHALSQPATAGNSLLSKTKTTEGSMPKTTEANAIKLQKEPKVSARKQTEFNPNKAEPVSVDLPKTPEPATPDIKTSKLADRVETIAIKKDLSSGFADKPEYAKVNMQKQADSAANLLKTDPDRLHRIAMGNERPPEGLLPESAWVAAVHNAKKTNNAQALLDLGTRSHLVSEASGMGQRIRALGELDNGSPAKHIKDIADIGNKTFEKKTGKSFDKLVKENVKQAKAAVPVKAKDWSSFVEALKC